MGEDKRMQALMYVVAGIFLAEGWQLVIHSMSSRGPLGLICALLGLVGGVAAGENIRKQSRPTALFWFSFVFHAFSLGFADTPLSAFVSLLIIGSGLPSLWVHLAPDPSTLEMIELAPLVVAFFVAKACAVVGVSHVSKTVLFGVGVIGMTGRIPQNEPAKPETTYRRPSGREPVPEEPPEPFVAATTDVSAQTYTPQWLGLWREHNLESIQECPAEMATLKLSSAPAPQAGGKRRDGPKGKDKGVGKGKKGFDKGGYQDKGSFSPMSGQMGSPMGKGQPFAWGKPDKPDLNPEFKTVVEDGKAEVGDDIRWNIIAEEMARIDAAKKTTPEATED
jgi:hypothetical protein